MAGNDGIGADPGICVPVGKDVCRTFLLQKKRFRRVTGGAMGC